MTERITHTEAFRPSNGIEGDIFYSKFCAACRHGGEYGDCSIFLDAMAFETDDPEYPKEWVTEYYQGRCLGARCTGFADARYPETTPRCPFTPDFFGSRS